MTDKLKPCPKCHKGDRVSLYRHYGAWRIECYRCNLAIANFHDNVLADGWDRDAIIARWNTRREAKDE